MIQFIIRLDAAPGKLAELDEFLNSHVADWAKGYGAQSACVYEDALVGWPEREIRIDFASMEQLQEMVNSEHWKQNKSILFRYATNVTSQIVKPCCCA